MLREPEVKYLLGALDLVSAGFVEPACLSIGSLGDDLGLTDIVTYCPIKRSRNERFAESATSCFRAHREKANVSPSPLHSDGYESGN